jgi:uncharacterized protein (TIGR00255 family)
MTIRSMTGFGRATADRGDRRVRVEVRSVNHRGLDLKIRSPEPDAYCDAEIAKAVKAAVERGAITVQVRYEDAGQSAGIDERRVGEVHAVLERLRQQLKIEEAVGLATIAAFMTAAGSSDERDGEALWELLRPAVSAALDDLLCMREREGTALAADLEAHRTRLLELSARLRSATAALPDRFVRRLQDRLAAVGSQPALDPARVAQEAALMAERLDVSEELVRLETHLAHVRDLCQGGGPIGRRLDFLIQELGRELNTIASKAQDAEVSTLVIDAKAELEKMREQAQNVE